MEITILYFASLREAVGVECETVTVPEGIDTVGKLRAWLRTRGPAWQAALDDARAVRSAVDRSIARAESPVGAGAEVAFFPPVTGG